MTVDDAIADLIARVKDACPEAVIRVKRRSDEEASIRVYAPVERAACQRFAGTTCTGRATSLTAPSRCRSIASKRSVAVNNSRSAPS